MNVGDAFNVAELFSGAGGLGLAIERVIRGARTVVHVEREAFACAVLASRMEEGRLASAPIWTDVTTFDGKPWRGVLDCVAFGSPCQDLSLAGKRAGLSGGKSGLFFEGIRIIDEARPDLAFWENVGGAGGSLPDVFDAFEAIGYSGKACCIRAADVGASHERARYFVLANRNDGGRHGRERIARWLATSRTAAEGAGCELAHRDSGTWRNDCRRIGGAGGAAGKGLARDVGEEVANGDRDGSRKLQLLGHDAERAHAASVRRPLPFPPGQDDFAAWAAVLAIRPDLAPAEPKVSRVVHGFPAELVSTWADEVRMGGNAVVPDQAAAALAFLLDAIGGD